MSKKTCDVDNGMLIINKHINNLLSKIDDDKKITNNINDFSEIYTIVYNMSIYDVNGGKNSTDSGNKMLYKNYTNIITEYMKLKCEKMKLKHGQLLIDDYIKQWNNLTIISKWIKKYFMYVEKSAWMLNSGNSFDKLNVKLFYKIIYSESVTTIVEFINSIINDHRNGASLDKFMFRDIINIFNNMESFGSLHFINLFMEETKKYYILKINEIISYSITDFIKIINKLLIVEDNVYLVLNKIYNTIIYDLLREKLNLFKTDFFYTVIQENRLEDAIIIYNYFRMLESIPFLITDFTKFIHNYIEKINEKNETFIEELINTMIHLKELIKNFDNDTTFNKIYTTIFENFVNKKREFSVEELLVQYISKRLKEKNSENEMNNIFDNICDVFLFMNDKDKFIDIYRNILAKRLLNEGISEDESSLISKLKFKCGYDYTKSLENMVNDLKISNDFNSTYKDKLKHFIDFNVTIMSYGSWPSFKEVSVNYPTEFETCISSFTSFYYDIFPKKKLKWMNSLGTVTLRCRYTTNYEVVVNTLQAVVLIYFNKKDNVLIDFNKIQHETSIEADVLKKVLHSLSCNKVKLLKKNPESSTINIEKDTFKINNSFKSNIKKIKIPMPTLDPPLNIKKIEEDRTFYIDAIIVRVMKSRKRLEHINLISEVISQVKLFQPEPKFIKKRIESLLERDYLERDEDNSSIYKYVA